MLNKVHAVVYVGDFFLQVNANQIFYNGKYKIVLGS